MLYNWSIKDLIKARKKLTKMYTNENNQEKKDYIKSVLRMLNIYIEEEEYFLAKNNSNPNEELEYSTSLEGYDFTLSSIEHDLQTSKHYYSLVKLFQKRTAQLEDDIDDIEKILSQRLSPEDSYAKITGAKISTSKALGLTKKFYKIFFPSLYPTFLRAFKKRFTSIRFKKPQDNTMVADSAYIDLIKRYFINVEKTNDISKLYNFIHEFGHIISYIINPKSLYLSKEFIFNEVAALFPEIIAQYENYGNIPKDHIAFEAYLTLLSYINHANSLCLHEGIIQIWNENNRIANQEFFNTVQKEYSLNQEDLDSVLSTSIDDEAIYIISYMVSLELLHIYKQDKAKAIMIYRTFLRIPQYMSIEEFFNRKISIGAHTKEETKSIIKTLKLELNNSGEFNV